MDYYQKVETFRTQASPLSNKNNSNNINMDRATPPRIIACDWQKHGEMYMTYDLRHIYVCSTCAATAAPRPDGTAVKAMVGRQQSFVTSEIQKFWEHVQRSHTLRVTKPLETASLAVRATAKTPHSEPLEEPLAKRAKTNNVIVINDDDDDDDIAAIVQDDNGDDDDDQDTAILKQQCEPNQLVQNFNEKISEKFLKENAAKIKEICRKPSTNLIIQNTLLSTKLLKPTDQITTQDIIMDFKKEPEFMLTQYPTANDQNRNPNAEPETIVIDEDDDEDYIEATKVVSSENSTDYIVIDKENEAIAANVESSKNKISKMRTSATYSEPLKNELNDTESNEQTIDLNEIIKDEETAADETHLAEEEAPLAQETSEQDSEDNIKPKAEVDLDLFTIVKERTLEDYLEHYYDTIELSDDEDDEDDDYYKEALALEGEQIGCITPSSKCIDQSSDESVAKTVGYTITGPTNEHQHEQYNQENWMSAADQLPSSSTTPSAPAELQCQFCAQRFQTPLEKLRHEMIHIPRKRPFKCNTCSRTTSTTKAMETHLRRFHSGVVDEDTAPCDICQKVVLKRYMTQHQQTHMNVRFPCEFCERSYRHKSTLRKHVKVFHSAQPVIGNVENRLPINIDQEHAALLSYIMAMRKQLSDLQKSGQILMQHQ